MSALDDKVDEVRGSYALVRNTLDRLPEGRMKSLAITSLEESFSRALFAVSEMTDPIRGKSAPKTVKKG